MNNDLRLVKELVRQGENGYIEFKRKVAHPEKLVKEVVAFANSDGGHLLIGVDDNGGIPGVKFPEEEEYVMSKAITDLCKPQPSYEVEIIHLDQDDERAVIHYKIHSDNRKPYFAKERSVDKYGKAYVRVEDRSIQASKEVKEILKRVSRPGDISFRYGDKEKLLMQYLDKNGEITLSKFREMADIPKYQASRKLILLVAANVLEVQPREKEDVYVMKTKNDELGSSYE